MSPVVRSALMGAGLALVLVGAVVALVLYGVVELPRPEKETPKVAVIGLAADSEGAETASVVVVIQAGSPLLPDVDATTTVAGTSSTTVRTAYPFGGGAIVMDALRPQVGPLSDWLVLPAATWAALIDDAGGVEVTLSEPVNAYFDGELTTLEAGSRRLDGREAVILSEAARYLPEEERIEVSRTLQSAFAEAIRGAEIAELVSTGGAATSMNAAELRLFEAGG